MTPYAEVLGADLERLPPACAALHRAPGQHRGRITVTGGWGPLRWLARLAGLPRPVEDAPLLLRCAPEGGRMIWRREIGDQVMSSTQWAAGGLLVEHLGPSVVGSELVLDDAGLHLQTRSVRVFGLPMPRLFWPGIRAREWQQDGRYHFEIAVHLPLGGPRLTGYRGWLSTLDQQSL